LAPRLTAPFHGRALLVDNSAFQRGNQALVRDEWLRALEEGQLYRSPLLELETLYSARNAREYADMKEELGALRPTQLVPATIEAALAAQAELAHRGAGFHRLSHADYLEAAIAAAHGLGVLHYDGDFDRIAGYSSLAFESVWIAPSGSLDKEGQDPLRQHRRAVTHALAQFEGARAKDVLERILDLLGSELLADGLQPPVRP
jgi:predicted nucleic acid-binding protein